MPRLFLLFYYWQLCSAIANHRECSCRLIWSCLGDPVLQRRTTEWQNNAKRMKVNILKRTIQYRDDKTTFISTQSWWFCYTQKEKKTDSICIFDQKTDPNVSNLFLDSFLSLLPIFTKCLLIKGHGVGYVSIMVGSLAYNVKHIKVSAVIWCHIKKKTELKLNVFQVCRVPLRNKYYKYSVI